MMMMMMLVVGRLLMAVLLKHHGLGRVVINLLSSTAAAPPACLVDVCKVVHQARTALIKVLSVSDIFVPTICLAILTLYQNVSDGQTDRGTKLL